MVGSHIIIPISEEKAKVQEGSDLTRTPAVARPGWKSVTFFQDCFIEPLRWARASARREWDAASRPCREQPLCMSRRASSLPPLGPISPSPRSPAREGSRRTRAPAQVGRASLCLGWASRERALASGVPSGLVQAPGPPPRFRLSPSGGLSLPHPRPLRTGWQSQMASLCQVCAAGLWFSVSSAFESSLEGSGEKRGGPGDRPPQEPPAAQA